MGESVTFMMIVWIISIARIQEMLVGWEKIIESRVDCLERPKKKVSP